MATLAQMRTSLRAYIGNPTTASVADSVLTDAINRAYRRICDTNKLPQTVSRDNFNTAIGTASYNLVANLVHIYKVWNKTMGYPLTPTDPPILYDFDTTDNVQPRTGVPCRYYRNSGTIQLMPSPDAVYKIEVVSKFMPALLVNDADVPVIQELWHEGIVLLGRWYYFDSTFDYPKAQYAFGVWQSWLQSKPNEMHQESVTFDDAVELPMMTQGRTYRSRSFDF